MLKYTERWGKSISRNGDLINHVYLQFQLPALSVGSIYAAGATQPNNVAWTNSIGHALIRGVEILIGGQRMDQHYGIWLEIWNELTQVSEKENGYNHKQHVVKSNMSCVCRHYTSENIWNSALKNNLKIQLLV